MANQTPRPDPNQPAPQADAARLEQALNDARQHQQQQHAQPPHGAQAAPTAAGGIGPPAPVWANLILILGDAFLAWLKQQQTP